jgi:polar amino acid transport system permease protein
MKAMPPSQIKIRQDPLSERLAQFPWWLLAIILIAIWAAYIILSRENFQQAFNTISIGISTTISTTLISYSIALVIGLITGLGRISRNVLIRNLATLYVELIRGVPILVLIFFIALVLVPSLVDSIQGYGDNLVAQGNNPIGPILASIENSLFSMNVRAIIALSVTYGAFMAEIFRAGIQSIGRGQMEAARSLGMNYGQSLRYIILPQAIRNVLPALGNDFIAMVKDSSLVSVLAVRDITQVARLYAGRTFRFREAYSTLAALYLTMTLVLSFVVKWLERRFQRDGE